MLRIVIWGEGVYGSPHISVMKVHSPKLFALTRGWLGCPIFRIEAHNRRYYFTKYTISLLIINSTL